MVVTTMPVKSKANMRDETPVTIRPIVARDLFTVVKVVMPKLDVARIRELFTGMPVGGTERDDYFKTAGIEMVTMLISVAAEDSIQEWLADLAGMTLDQFLNSPVTMPFDIIMAAAKDEDLRKIFTSLLT